MAEQHPDKPQNARLNNLTESVAHFEFKTLKDCVDTNDKHMHGRSPAHTNYEDGPFDLHQHKDVYDPYLKIYVRDMKYERAKWSALHISMLNKNSKGLRRHKRENMYKSVYCNQSSYDQQFE